jgi:predicted transcriptional regulator
MEKKDAAKLLYNEGWTQAEIAACLKITESNISRWAKSGNWKQNLASKEIASQKAKEYSEEILLYQLEALRMKAKNYRMNLDDMGELPLLDKEHLSLAAKVINDMKTPELKFQQMVRIIDEFTQFASEEDIEIAKRLAAIGPAFIELKRKSL